MDSPASVGSLSVQPSVSSDLAAAIPQGAKSKARFLRTFGFQVLAALLGIALIFM